MVKDVVNKGFYTYFTFPRNSFLGCFENGKTVFGNFFYFLGMLLGDWFYYCFQEKRCAMRKKGYKGRCEKRILEKCKAVCRTYDVIQSAYADILQNDEDIIEIRCNVLLDGLELGEYTSDFVCTKSDKDLMVRECVNQKFLMKPMTVKLLDASREYWLRRGVTDWKVVTNEE